jgi:UDP-2-acetamido-3-amino-2,3-dideoxy-glucuronate N-acetyltransferase
LGSLAERQCQKFTRAGFQGFFIEFPKASDGTTSLLQTVLGEARNSGIGDAPVTAQIVGDVFVHPRGLCESDTVGRGTRVWAFAHVMSGARVGRDCNVGDGAYIEGGAIVGDRVTVKNQVMIFEGVTIADDVFLGPGVTFTNDRSPRAHIKRSGAELLGTTVGRGATLGARVTVVCGTTIGEYAFIGAGAVVIEDVPAHAFVVGNPGRTLGWACWCGLKLPATLRCSCGREFAQHGTKLRELAA